MNLTKNVSNHTLQLKAYSYKDEDGICTAWIGNVITEGETEKQAVQNLENALYDIFHNNPEL